MMMSVRRWKERITESGERCVKKGGVMGADYFENLKVILRGGGSDQARYHEHLCHICNDMEEEREEEEDGEDVEEE